MLASLVELAARKNLLEDTAFVERPVHFVLVLDERGEVLNIRSNLDERAKPRPLRVPPAPRRTVGVDASFLVDGPQYVFGLAKDVSEKSSHAAAGDDAESAVSGEKASRSTKEEAKKQKAERRAQECLDAFASLVREAHEQTSDAALGAVLAFLEAMKDKQKRETVLAMAKLSSKRATAKKGSRGGAKKTKGSKGSTPTEESVEVEEATTETTMKPYEWTGAETLAFELVSDEGKLIHERPAVAQWWRGRQQQAQSEGERRRCLVTGAVAPVRRLHPQIKGVPDSQTGGASLVSFNGAAFESWGFKQGDNAPVSAEAAEAYGRALNWLLQREGARRFRQGIQVADNSVMVFWARPGASEDLGASLPDLIDMEAPQEASPEEYRRSIEAVWKGLEVSKGDEETPFYAMTLGSNASRVVVRDWFETTAATVKRNVWAWFDLLKVGEVDGEQTWRPPSISELLRAMQARPDADGDKGGLPPASAARLVRSALYGERLGAEVLQAALARVRLPVRDERGERRRLAVRMGLIRAALCRPAWTQQREVTVALDESNRDVAYVLGRLFCIIESLQLRAQGQDLNASVRDKFFASASSTPASVFGVLLQRAQHHISKRDGQGDYELSKVMDLLPGQALPAVLSLEQQGLFALGYYHQREHGFRKAAEHKAKQQAKGA